VTRPLRELDLAIARRLAIHAQGLSGPPPGSSPANVLDAIRRIRCVQLDPIAVVARSPLLVLRSRIDGFDPAHLERLLWRERSLFEYFAHAASIVLTEDLPIHAWYMRRFLRRDRGWDRRALEWMEANAKLRRSILARLRREGPLASRELADLAAEPWRSTGWTDDRNVDRMLSLLWGRGVVMVAGRRGQVKLWDLAERVLPVSRGRLSDLGVTTQAAERSLLGLGVGTPQHIRGHFTRNRYPELARALAALERGGRVERVRVLDDGRALPGTWFVHRDHLGALEAIEAGGWDPRTTMLSPFDNLIADRARAELLFDLAYRIEIYVPRAARRYGYYAMPVLHGDRFVARVDPAVDRDRGVLRVHAVTPEPGAGRAVAPAVGAAVRELATWVGASRIEVAPGVPAGWRRALG
jgi:hypothetical protein